MLEDRRFPKLHLNFHLRLNKFQYLRPELNIPSLLLTTCLFVYVQRNSDAAPPQPTDATVLVGSSNRKDPPTENVPEGKKPRIA
ncbi:hypothetical protein HID58_076543 [Brassica napus]|uniref:Uncharacterized protein n=1 Tax=Brassica napus TaxID=3708 RepID=A0ABQ7YMZ1_BRANA|nr:hypothetical protein HID58_076543 [Brassica napus]